MFTTAHLINEFNDFFFVSAAEFQILSFSFHSANLFRKMIKKMNITRSERRKKAKKTNNNNFWCVGKRSKRSGLRRTPSEVLAMNGEMLCKMVRTKSHELILSPSRKQERIIENENSGSCGADFYDSFVDFREHFLSLFGNGFKILRMFVYESGDSW